MTLCRIGGHELKSIDSQILLKWSPQVYVIARTSEHGDAIAKGLARVRHVKELLPNTKIGVRWGSDPNHYDNQQSSRITPEQYADDFFKLHVDGTLLMPDNEAAASESDSNVFRAVVAWWVKVVELATTRGITLGIGCTPTGVPDYPQYVLLAPLFRAMRDAARLGVVHWWRPNAYYVPSDPNHAYHHSKRHQREGRIVCAMQGLPFPPFFLGEFAPIGSYHDAEYGYKRMGWSGEQLARSIIAEGLTDPHCVYSAGDGIYNDQWAPFDYREDDGFFNVISTEAPRVPDNTNVVLEQNYIQASRSVVVTQFPKPDLTPLHEAQVTAAPAAGANVRTAPDTGAPFSPLGPLHVGDDIMISESFHFNNGYNWHQTDTGYVADTPGFDWEPKTAPALPPNNPPIDVDAALKLAEIMESTAQSHADLLERYIAMAAILRSLFN